MNPLEEKFIIKSEKDEKDINNVKECSLKMKRKNISILEKLQIIKEFDEGTSTRELNKKYNIPSRTIRNYIATREKLEQYRTSILSNSAKRIKATAFNNLDEALYIWYNQNIKCGTSLTGPLIMAKALELHRDLNIAKDFVASEGWLSNWKKKYGIRLYGVSGEKLSDAANCNNFNDFKREFKKTIQEEQLDLCQIFNAYETKLNYKMMPKRMLDTKFQSTPTDLKENKDYVTVMVCSNADGTFKLPLLVIGKTAKCRAIKNMSESSLPVYYTHQRSAWMNAHIFEVWFKEEFVPRVTKFLTEKGLSTKALLLLDSVPCHPASEMLAVGDIKVKYLPSNTTSVMQLMDQSIIENFKRFYRTLFLLSILTAQKNSIHFTEYLKSISIENVVCWMGDAWDSVKKETISKCWNEFLQPGFWYVNVNVDDNMTNEEILYNFQKLYEYEDITYDQVQNWIHSNDEESNIPTNSELIAMVTPDDVEGNNDGKLTEIIKPEEAVSAANTLISFFEKNELLSTTELATLRKAKYIAMKLAIENDSC